MDAVDQEALDPLQEAGRRRTVAQLKEELEKRGLSTKGTKSSLEARLRDAVRQASDADAAPDAPKKETGAASRKRARKGKSTAADDDVHEVPDKVSLIASEINDERDTMQKEMTQAQKNLEAEQSEAEIRDQELKSKIQEDEGKIAKLKQAAQVEESAIAELKQQLASRSNWLEVESAKQKLAEQQVQVNSVGSGCSEWFKRRLHDKWSERILEDLTKTLCEQGDQTDARAVVEEVFGKKAPLADATMNMAGGAAALIQPVAADTMPRSPPVTPDGVNAEAAAPTTHEIEAPWSQSEPGGW